MNTNVQCRSMQIQVNRFKMDNERKPENGTPFSFILRCFNNIRLNSFIIDQFMSKTGILFGNIWQRVIKWNLGGIFWTILLTIYQFAFRPLMMSLMRNFRILLRRVEHKLMALQEYFYGKMEDLFNHEEPGDYLFKMQCTNGQQVDYQYEIAWVERTFVIIQVVELFLRYFAHRTLATFEKAWIELNKFQNRSKPAFVIEMPEFEITNPEIFNSKPDSLKSKIKNWIPGLRQPAQHTINHTLQHNAKIVSVSENHFSIKIFGINLHQHLMDIQIGNASISRIHFRIKNIINQLVKSQVNCKISELFRFFKPKGFNKIFYSIFNRRL